MTPATPYQLTSIEDKIMYCDEELDDVAILSNN
jgi:hypothetical protein